jgi:hypothetical protein
MESASDVNLCVPQRGTEKKGSQLLLFPVGIEPKGAEETKSSLPSVWKGVSEREWNDWRWQLRNRITTVDKMKEVIELDPGDHAIEG